MASYLGKNGAVRVGGTAIAEIRDWSVETTAEVVADTVMGDDWVSNKHTISSWTGSFNALWDESDAGQIALVAGATVAVEFHPEGSGAGAYELSGSAIITSVSRSASYDGLVEASFSVTGNGELTIGTV